MPRPRNKSMTPELRALRRAVERDRYGLVAQVLVARDRCTPMDCAAFRSLTDNHQIAANMDEHTYDALVARYAPSWNAPAAVAAGDWPRRTRIAGAPIRADRQADQCRIPERRLDAAGEHHDAGAGPELARLIAIAATCDGNGERAIPPRPSTQTGAAPTAALAPAPPPAAATGKKPAAKQPPTAPASAPVQLPQAQPTAESND